MKYTLGRGNDPKKVAFSLNDGVKSHQIEAKKAFDTLRSLTSKGEVMLGGKKILYDPFVVYRVYIEVDGLTVHPYFSFKDQKIPFHVCPLILFDAHPFFVYEGIIRSFEGGFPKIERFFSSIVTLKPDEMESFLEDYHTDPPEWGPTVEILNPIEKGEILVGSSNATYQIFLTDETGAFINLETIGASKKEHERFVQDVIDAGYVYKPLQNSTYYCPTHEVKNALSLLTELGYHVFGPKKEKVIFASKIDQKILIDEKHVKIQGSVNTTKSVFSLKDMLTTYSKGKLLLKGEEESLFLDLAQIEELSRIPLKYEKEKILINRYYAPHITERLKEGIEGFFSYEQQKISKDFSGELFEFQQQGFDWLFFHYKNRLAALLADEMGLGKTVQTIAFLSTVLKKEKALIVAPLTLLHQWKSEIERFSKNLNTIIVDRETDFEDPGVYLVSYQMLRSMIDQIGKVIFEVFILDEAQQIKNNKTKGYEAALRVQANFKLALSGTPVENRVQDIVNLFSILLPDLFLEVDIKDLERIKVLTKPFVLRRLKKEVLQQLPEKIEQSVYLDLYEEQKKSYNELLSDLKEKINTQKGHVFEALSKLRQHVLSPALLGMQVPSAKFDQVLLDVVEMVESGQKVLVFSSFVSLLKILHEQIKDENIPLFFLDGKTTNRHQIVEDFKKIETGCVFLLSLKAGGVGLNLVEADTVIVFEPWWNPQAEMQAIDRAHRVGRKDSLFAKRYIVLNTIEEYMENIKKEKSELASTIIEENSPACDELQQMLLDLL